MDAPRPPDGCVGSEAAGSGEDTMTDERPTESVPIAPGRGRSRDMWRLGWGIVFILVGGWFFLERTLDVDLPRIPWGDLWPVLIIALGLWILVRGWTRSTR